ncbi:methyl-accepting chemotaxis protein [Sessilibacter sp. MAH4]
MIRNLSIQNRMILQSALVALGLVVLMFDGLSTLKETLYHSRTASTENVVSTAHSILERYYKLEQQGTLSRQQAQEQAKEAVGALRYQDGNYFWIQDMNLKMVMHPIKSELIGQNLSEIKDSAGKNLFVEMDRVVKEQGAGSVSYMWPAIGSQEIVGKIGYVIGFQPWQWIVGSGVYTTDIETAFWNEAPTQIVISAIIIVIVLSFSIYISRSISLPLQLTSRALKDIAEGDGDLTRRLDVNGNDELAEMAKNFNAIVIKIDNTLAEVAHATAMVETSSKELDYNMQNSKEVLDKQQKQSETAVQAIMELVQTVSEIARNAEGAASSAQEANREAEMGQGVVEQAKASVNNLAEEVQQAAMVIKNVNTDSQAISSVLEVIRGIAEQTNLLALNAAIEAARAGEQGRGFAVVADEVRTLAARTQSSTEEIRSMIESLQNGSEKAVITMDNGEKTTAITVEKAAAAGQSLSSIVASINSISDLNLQIASAAEEQSAAVQEIDQSISLMANYSNQSHFGIEKTADTTRELAELSSRLRQLVGQFKLSR